MPVAILMPAYDESGRVHETLAALRDRARDFGGLTVFLVDDGSRRPIDAALLPRGEAFRVVLARHVVNLGQGAALETARQLALREPRRYEAYVTMDSDGQHRVEDALAMARAIRDGADVAFGNRFDGASNVPPLRRLLLAGARLLERVLTGMRLGDAHNGLRAFHPRALERIAIRQNRMAHATEITLRVSRASLVVVEVPVSVRYTKETLAKGQRTAGAADVLRDLLLDYLFRESR